MPPEVEGRKNQENILYFIFLNLFLLNIEGKEDLVNEKIIREKKFDEGRRIGEMNLR